MKRTVAAAFCILWLVYGSLSGVAHIHADTTPDQLHGLGLDHAHDSRTQQRLDHDHIYLADGSASDAQHAGFIYLTVTAIRPVAKIVTMPIDLAGELLPTTRAPLESEHIATHLELRSLPSKAPPGPRAPPA